MIYLDNAATTQISTDVLSAMIPWFCAEYGNPESVYRPGWIARDAVVNARKQVADFIGAEPSQIVFTSGGSEANSLALAGIYARRNPTLVVSEIEHSSIISCCANYNKVLFVSPDKDGVVTVDSVKAELAKLSEDEPAIVSVMMENNETGVVNPVDEISRAVHMRKDTWFHTDCVQAAYANKINVKEIGCDMLSISSHKLHGPKGVGALYVKDVLGVKKWTVPRIFGGAFQESGVRGGTENVPGIVGFGAACDEMRKNNNISEQMKALRDAFLNYLKHELDGECGFLINGEHSSGKIINIAFRGVDGESLRAMLGARGVFVSTGSACTSLEQEPSHVLTAMGVSGEVARCSIRISFSKLNTETEVEYAAKVISECVKMLKSVGAGL